MDVKEINGGSLASAATKKGKGGELNGLDFGKMLQEAQENGREGGQAAPAVSMGGVEIRQEEVLPLTLLDGVKESIPHRDQGVRAAEKALSLLEEYQRAIGNPRVTLREIDPLVRSLAEETRGLEGWMKNLSPSDPLKLIMDEVGILSATEIGKFNRGDYI